MEELRKISLAHYKASPENIKSLALDFFTTMDNDGDGQIDLHEFLAFMRDQGYAQMMTNRFFFDKLDLDHNGTLDFQEFMALYYTLKSGRPFCNHCGDFVPGAYFTCLACLENPSGASAFDLCLDCCLNRACDHTHQGVSHFVDNYSLLEAKVRSTLSNKTPPSSKAKSPPSTESNGVPPNDRQKWKIAFGIFEAAIKVASISATIASCTIS